MVPKMYNTWCLPVSSDILNIPDNPNIPEIPDLPPIPEIPIIIQISWSLWFRKGMTLDVCPVIPEILNIPDILTGYYKYYNH